MGDELKEEMEHRKRTGWQARGESERKVCGDQDVLFSTTDYVHLSFDTGNVDGRTCSCVVLFEFSLLPTRVNQPVISFFH